MRIAGLFFCLMILYGCGSDSDDPGNGTVFTSTLENIGNTFVLLNCNEASQRISSDVSQSGIENQVELGMSAQLVRAIAGKPRHIYLGVWTYAYDQPVNLPQDPLWDLIPTVTVTSSLAVDNLTIGATAFSGDNTLCDGSEIPFIADANTLTNGQDSEDHQNEIPDCVTAAKRIAANVELGMTIDQVRRIVGKPVEATVNGLWRYKYGPDPRILNDTPAVQFGEASLVGTTDEFGDQFFGDTEETGISNLRVVGYWSPENVCQI